MKKHFFKKLMVIMPILAAVMLTPIIIYFSAPGLPVFTDWIKGLYRILVFGPGFLILRPISKYYDSSHGDQVFLVMVSCAFITSWLFYSVLLSLALVWQEKRLTNGYTGRASRAGEP